MGKKTLPQSSHNFGRVFQYKSEGCDKEPKSFYCGQSDTTILMFQELQNRWHGRQITLLRHLPIDGCLIQSYSS